MSNSTFGGWNTNGVGTGVNYPEGSSLTPTGDITLYARWIAAGTATYTVTFSANGGSGTAPDPHTVTAGSSITLPGGGGLAMSSFTFGGWNTDTYGMGTNYSAGSSFTPTSDITLYAMWYYDLSSIHATVTYNANGGSGTPPEDRSWLIGMELRLPDGGGLTRSGSIFDGWNTNADGTGINYYSSYTPTGNVTLYANWNAITPNGIIISNTGQWDNALAAIRNGGSGTAGVPKTYTLYINGNVSVPGSYNTDTSFGSVQHIEVTLKGNGKLSRDSSGSILYFGDNQKLIVDSERLTLQGRSGSSLAVLYVTSGGMLELKNGTISGNSGGGVYVYGGTFTMNNGTISDNTASGNGDVVNLGIGLPTLVPNFLPPEIDIVFQSENGIIGMGPTPEAGVAGGDIVNAGPAGYGQNRCRIFRQFRLPLASYAVAVWTQPSSVRWKLTNRATLPTG
jgi:uncharacterized repeat protein (TIGR02543 family)